MDEKTAKILFILGMSATFPVLLAIMVSFMIPSTRSRPRRAQVTVEGSQSFRPASKPSPSRTQRVAAHPLASPDTAKTATTRAPAASSPPVGLSPAKQERIVPDPAATKQLALMEKELKQQLDALKKDRDAMLAALAQRLVPLTPSEAAQELRTLDDESAAKVLRHLSASRRREILSHLDTQRARRLRRKLQAYVSR